METIKYAVIAAVIVLATYRGLAATREIAFSQSGNSVAVYDYVEVTLRLNQSVAGNPFTDATVTGSFGLAGGGEPLNVDGFCDSADGSLFRVRFMPSQPGDYAYSVK